MKIKVTALNTDLRKYKVENKSSYTKINYYEPGDSPYIEYNLDIYDKTTFSHNYLFDYNKKRKELRIPKFISKARLNYLFKTSTFDNCIYNEYDKLGAKLKYPPRDKSQEDAINFITGQERHRGLDKYKRKMLELDTGVGKTYCVIASITQMKTKAGILLPTNPLMEQWKNSITTFTNISEKEIFQVSGSKSIDKILSGKCYKYKIFLISHRTISSYANKHGWDTIDTLFEKMRIGIKIFDEAHREMKNTVMIDLHSNVEHTLYLTATAERSAFNENKVYDNIFCTIPTLTIQRAKEESYVIGMILQYNSSPSLLELAPTKTIRGMNLIKYMDYQLFGKGRKYINKCLKLVIDTLIPKGGKMVILVLKRDGAIDIKKWLEEEYPEFKNDVGLFTSDVKKEDKVEQLKKRIIISTSKSFGFGIDLKDLRYVINCEPYSSKVTLKQIVGRLRKIDDVLQCYVELVDTGFTQRSNQFKQISKKLLELTKKCKIYRV